MTTTSEPVYQFPFRQSLYISFHPNNLLLCQLKSVLYIYSLSDGSIQKLRLKPNMRGIIDWQFVLKERLRAIDFGSLSNMTNSSNKMIQNSQKSSSEGEPSLFKKTTENRRKKMHIRNNIEQDLVEEFGDMNGVDKVHNTGVEQEVPIKNTSNKSKNQESMERHTLYSEWFDDSNSHAFGNTNAKFQSVEYGIPIRNMVRMRHFFVNDSNIFIDTDATRILASSVDIQSSLTWFQESFTNECELSKPSSHTRKIANSMMDVTYSIPEWHLLPVDNSYEASVMEANSRKRRKLDAVPKFISRKNKSWQKLSVDPNTMQDENINTPTDISSSKSPFSLYNGSLCGKWISKMKNNHHWLLTNTKLSRGVLNDSTWIVEEEYDIGKDINFAYIVESNAFHPFALTALFGSNASSQKLRILFVKRDGNIQATFLPAIQNRTIIDLQWRTFLTFTQNLHSIHHIFTPLHDKDKPLLTGLLFVGLDGLITIVWSFLPHTDKEDEETLSSEVIFEVKKHTFYLGCKIESIAIVQNHVLYTCGDGKVRCFPIFSVTETTDVLTNRQYFNYSLKNYADVRVLPLGEGLKSVCSDPDSFVSHFYYVSNNGTLIKSSLQNYNTIDQTLSHKISQRRLESSMDYSVNRLDTLDDCLCHKIATNNALNMRLYEWNCALSTVKWIKQHTNPFTCKVYGFLDENDIPMLRITMKNNTNTHLKDWKLIMLIQSTDMQKIASTSTTITHLASGDVFSSNFKYSFPGFYTSMKISLFLAYTKHSKQLGRSGFSTEIYSDSMTMLSFITPVAQSNILAYSKAIPHEISITMRAARALLTPSTFIQEIESWNSSIRSFQLHISPLVYNHVCKMIPEQFITSMQHLIHFHKTLSPIQKENCQVYQISVLCSNEVALQHLRHALLEYITPLQNSFDQSKFCNTYDEYVNVKSQLDIISSKIFELYQEVHDLICQTKDHDNFIGQSLKINHDIACKLYTRLQELYSQFRNVLRNAQFIY